MNSITEAMKKVGIVVPLKKRVWLWLKDHPDKTCKEIYLALNVQQGHVSAELHDMFKRGMVTARKEVLPGLKRFGERPVNVYRVTSKEYELLPVKKTPRPPVVKVEGPKVTVAVQEPNPVVKKKFSIDDLSVYEAKELYDQLKKIFG